MIFWIILILIQIVDTVLLVKFMKGNTVVRVEQKHVYTPVEHKRNNNHGGHKS